jgi:hypothetical protein
MVLVFEWEDRKGRKEEIEAQSLVEARRKEEKPAPPPSFNPS